MYTVRLEGILGNAESFSIEGTVDKYSDALDSFIGAKCQFRMMVENPIFDGSFSGEGEIVAICNGCYVLEFVSKGKTIRCAVPINAVAVISQEVSVGNVHMTNEEADELLGGGKNES